MRRSPLALVALLFVGCPEPEPVAPVFPADYASTFLEVRDCRRSPEHELAFIRVLASPDAAGVYTSRTGSFPVGAVIVKEEHASEGCDDPIGWTAMRREDGDAWRWQEVAPDRVVIEDGAIARCAGCHARCVAPDHGFEQTCAEP
ncbi:hypothetical protein [Sandaracinus amylolyticus]|uniref:hypothetical protein n=1 Tax=Sandaracinus amylolyticus TaxID=927083 RepID=UPI001F468D94|nr:hypothetical protein [Sandaracinus amylolyticus]UJR85687.1 Hypothetical protein I5071_77670 [Sandaracinus amylolyticus]